MGAAAVTTAAVPTVSETKRSFLENNPKPLPGLYTPIVNELLVQQHLIVFNKTYKHDPVSSLGLLSVWDGVMEGAPNVDSEVVQGPPRSPPAGPQGVPGRRGAARGLGG